LRRDGAMRDKVERWMEVCTLGAQEQDSKKLLDVTNEILRRLDEQKRRPSHRRGHQTRLSDPDG
jgi:hypothetical protein